MLPYVLAGLCTLMAPHVAWLLEFTFITNVQVCPPMLNAKLAIPLVAGVPVIVYVKLPAPLSKVPAAKEAVKPVTPVEDMVCAE